MHLESGDTLITQGDVSDTVYLLVEGSLQVSRDLDDITAVIANVDEPGSLIGEMVAIGGGKRTATVTANETSELIAVAVSDFGALRARWRRDGVTYPRMSAVLMRSMITASMRERDAQVQDGLADCYLDLDIRGVSMLAFDSPREVAERGYESAMPVLEKWMETLTSAGGEEAASISTAGPSTST
ncbi:MAG TPA: cyclic nucleotide-binding domain-containing protein [Acidimicrobiia bacterium]|nr:cyclic nucleotide-binding domain-containing protein [Acidimicrobiia bacterium]